MGITGNITNIKLNPIKLSIYLLSIKKLNNKNRHYCANHTR